MDKRFPCGEWSSYKKQLHEPPLFNIDSYSIPEGNLFYS